MQLFTHVAPQPAGLVLKPMAAKGTVPSSASSYGPLRRRTNFRSPLPARWNERRMGRSSCPAARTKARDDDDEAEPEPEPQEPAKEGEEEEAKRKRGGRSFAYQLFEAFYLCVLFLSWRIGGLIVWNVQDGLKRLRGYVLGKFNKKR